ncbi:MAG TPA: hypothetical protein VF522_12110 [Ramlibacter sp.]|uniref:hypothetical protein n=1 Tax=Ramlibacter sp. TaxID=1917967 RepID=UPI002ED43AF2
MKKIVGIVLAATALGAGAVPAGSYDVLQDADCPLVGKAELAGAVQRAGKVTNLNLPKDMVLRTELLCTADQSVRGRFYYTVRASIEKLVSDGEQQRWATVARHTGYGSTAGSTALLREVQFTVRDLVRQEP